MAQTWFGRVISMPPDAKRLADLQNARAALVEAQDALFQFSPGHTPALFVCTPLAVLLVAAAQLDALGLGPRQPGIYPLHDHGALELGEDATYLKHRPARRGGRVDGLLVQRNSAQRQGIAPEFNQERAEGLSRFVEPMGRPMTSSIGTIVPVTLLNLNQNQYRNYAPGSSPRKAAALRQRKIACRRTGREAPTRSIRLTSAFSWTNSRRGIDIYIGSKNTIHS
jgi:hypothetical protein